MLRDPRAPVLSATISERKSSSVLSGIRWIANANSGASAVLQTLLTQIAVLGIALLTGVVSARALGVVGRGQLAAIVLWPQVFAGLFALGIPAALVFHAKVSPEDERSLFFAAIGMSTLASAFMLVAGLISIPRALHDYGSDTVAYALGYLLVSPQVLVSYVLVAHLQVRGAFRDANFFRLIPATATLAGLVVFSTTHRLTPSIAAACYLLPPLPAFVIVLYRALKTTVGPRISVRVAGRRIVGYAFRAAGIDLLGTLSSQVDQLMVVSFLDPASMGAYVVALSISRVPNVFIVAMQQVISPRAASLDPEPLTELVGRCTRLATSGMLVSGLVLGAILPFVLPHLFGHDFVRSIASARVLLIELILSGAATLLAESFKGVGRPGTVTILQALSLASSVLLLFVLIPHFGLTGAALALLSTAIVRLAILLLLYRRTVGTAPPRLILTGSDVRFVSDLLRAQLRAKAAA